MYKLLSAGFARLWKTKIFWFAAAAMFIFAAAVLGGQYRSSLEIPELDIKLNDFAFGYLVFIGVITSVFSSLFLGDEYSDGTIRNKLIVGHKRINIYLSNLIVTIAAALMICVAFLAVIFSAGIPLLGFFDLEGIGLSGLIAIFIGNGFTVCAFCAILTAISMLIQNKAVAAIVSVLGMMILLFAAISLQLRIDEPEFLEGIEIVNGVFREVEGSTPNPMYLTGIKRSVYEYAFDIIPSGQALQYSGMAVSNPWIFSLYSIALSAVSTFTGLFFFCKKDIK